MNNRPPEVYRSFSDFYVCVLKEVREQGGVWVNEILESGWIPIAGAAGGVAGYHFGRVIARALPITSAFAGPLGVAIGALAAGTIAAAMSKSPRESKRKLLVSERERSRFERYRSLYQGLDAAQTSGEMSSHEHDVMVDELADTLREELLSESPSS